MSAEHPKNGVGNVQTLKAINAVFCLTLFPKTLGIEDSRLLVITLKVIYFTFFGRFSKHNEACFA